ncbi:hypothetical protein K491DRAFT_47074 [Lophiostoma macrostomum CBS 122681]|uniref:Cell wall anchored protein n=1 Tax=Lophiostoma macrostomum CBS 122681 TaxID=1314788 RepID=A0A6A6T0R8_9PLEO|nr:hypothetical protein K491DRAFT_47074 [Lophiostoma macrostomum CBS 122681]
MRAMAFLRLCLVAAISFAARSLQAKDPLNDFCRRWGHQTAQVGGKLYIDGGLVGWNPLSTNTLNYTNTWLLYSDLNTTIQGPGMPQQYANLTKNSTVPSVSGGTLWADEVNECFYQFGGEFQNNPEEFSFWVYDTALNQWNDTHYTSNVQSLQRVSYGAGTQIPELGLGFYYGGWMNNNTTPGWHGNPIATSNLVQFDFNTGALNNNTGPDSMGRAEGSMVYIPASDGGLLVYFGGVEDPHMNGSFVGANMSTIQLFDVSSSKWYTQTAGGTVPDSRRQFCAGVTWADDHSSYNIYLYGGFSTDQSNVTGFDDAYILSLPSFTWIKAFPTDNSTTQFGHGGCSGNVINRDQMLIIGGWFPETDQCDANNAWGQHNMNLGYNGPAKGLWDKYDLSISAYYVPTPIISAVGGGPTGGASTTAPASWDNHDLGVLITRIATFSNRAATRTLPTSTGQPSGSGKSKTNVGAIAGGVIGGLAALIAILSLILFCLHRRKKALKNKGPKETAATSPPPAELAATSPVHEMASPGAAKYMSMHESDPNIHPLHSTHSGSPINQYAQQAAPYQLYQTITPNSAAPPYASQQDPYAHTNQTYQQHQNSYAPYSDNPAASAYTHPDTRYDPNAYPLSDRPQHQRNTSYPSPKSPQHAVPAQHSPHQQQQHHQVYYPPPQEPTTRDYSDRLASPDGTQYSGDTATQMAPSTTNTPAQFYAQPVAVRPGEGLHPGSAHGGAGFSPGGFGGEGGSWDGGSNISARGSIDSRRRPIRGRFVEVDHM